MFGGPEKAQNIKVIRSFSRRCAAVSLPLPVRLRKRDAPGTEHGEGSVEPLGAEIDAAFRPGGGDEKHFLGGDEILELLADVVMPFGHFLPSFSLSIATGRDRRKPSRQLGVAFAPYRFSSTRTDVSSSPSSLRFLRLRPPMTRR